MNKQSSAGDLLHRYFSGRATGTESAKASRWLASLEMTAEEVSAEDMARMKEVSYRAIISTAATPEVIPFYKKRVALVAAASIVVLLFAAAWLYTATVSKPATAPMLATTVIHNKGRQVKYVQLPDGSQVWMNSNTVLSLNENYNRQQRQVKLEGEAYFEIKKDAQRPFTVSTANIDTRVLGTGFNVEAYPDETEIRVALVHGKVALENHKHPGNTALLKPDEMMRYSRQTDTWEMLPVEGRRTYQWTKGYMVFNELPLEEALQRIKHRYNLTLQYDTQLLKGKRVTASFEHDSWEGMLQQVLFLYDLRFFQKNGIIYIKQ
jgi:transmembrane sensor